MTTTRNTTKLSLHVALPPEYAPRLDILVARAMLAGQRGRTDRGVSRGSVVEALIDAAIAAGDATAKDGQ